jgi:hypothetical protein
MPFPVHGTLQYFAGSWLLSRRILDRRAGLIGRMSGTVHFTPDQDGLNYTETGTMTYGAHRGPASQTYRWVMLEDGQVEIRFKDGRLFHPLDLRQGMMVVDHQCADDHYRGRFRMITANRWFSRWQIAGPRKDVTIVSLFQRAPAATDAI